MWDGKIIGEVKGRLGSTYARGGTMASKEKRESSRMRPSVQIERRQVNGFPFGLLIGAAAMYFMDSRSGSRRRALVRDKVNHWQKAGIESFEKQTRNISNRFYGMLVEAQHWLDRRKEEVDDTILVQRIRSKMGRVLSHPKMVHVEVLNGRVKLSGYALGSELPRLYDSIRHVRGVRSIMENKIQSVIDEREMSSFASNQSRSQKMNVPVGSSTEAVPPVTH
jgi:hypothetical protein